MSSTGRVADRENADNYPTPSWCVRRLLERLQLPAGLWAEPCVGEGAIVRAVNKILPDVEWLTQDIRDTRETLPKDRLMFRHGSFLTDPDPDIGKAMVVFTNPPFGKAQEVIMQAQRLAPQAIHVYLQRLNFLGSEERHSWLSSRMPDVYQLPNRPSFVKGKTDSIEYGWFVWRPGEHRTVGTIQLLGLTSLAERRGAGEADGRGCKEIR